MKLETNLLDHTEHHFERFTTSAGLDRQNMGGLSSASNELVTFNCVRLAPKKHV